MDGLKSATIAAAMTAASWLFVTVWPVWLYPYLIFKKIAIGDAIDPWSWVFALMMCAVSGATSHLAVLAAFKQIASRPVFAQLFAINLVCVSLAALSYGRLCHRSSTGGVTADRAKRIESASF